MIEIQSSDGVAVVELKHGVTNPLGPELIDALQRALEELAADGRVRALVLAGSNRKFFSIGFDLPALVDLERAEFARFYGAVDRLCLKLFTLPKPVVAALEGHAVAGGCVLALCCDRRLLSSERKKMGLNEVLLGVPVPYLADRVLRELVGARTARDVLESGVMYDGEAARALGLADELLPAEELRPRALELAAELGGRPPRAFAELKRNRTEAIAEDFLARELEKREAFLDCWFSEPARGLLEAARAKF